jgi:hypothetical protein
MALAAGTHVEAARFFHAARDTLAAAGDSGMRQVGGGGEGAVRGCWRVEGGWCDWDCDSTSRMACVLFEIFGLEILDNRNM